MFHLSTSVIVPNMASGKSVFIVGPGFIGWNVLDNLVSEGYKISGLVRRDEHAKGIEKSGAMAIKGNLDDHELIAEHAEKNDVRGYQNLAGFG